MEDVGGEKRRYLANVGEGFFHVILNEPRPIDWTVSGHCSEHVIRHGYPEPLRLLRIKDGQNKLYHPPLSGVPTIPGVKSVLRVVLPSEFSYTQTILAASPPFALPWSKYVNLRPYLGRPFLRILLNGPKSLVSPLEQEFPQCHLTLEISEIWRGAPHSPSW